MVLFSFLIAACNSSNNQTNHLVYNKIERNANSLRNELINLKKLLNIYIIQLDEDVDFEYIISEKDKCGVTGNCFWTVLNFQRSTNSFNEQGEIFGASINFVKSKQNPQSSIQSIVNLGGRKSDVFLYHIIDGNYVQCDTCQIDSFIIKDSFQEIKLENFKLNVEQKFIFDRFLDYYKLDSMSLDTIGNLFYLLSKGKGLDKSLKVFELEGNYFREIGFFSGCHVMKSNVLNNNYYELVVVNHKKEKVVYSFDGLYYQVKN